MHAHHAHAFTHMHTHTHTHSLTHMHTYHIHALAHTAGLESAGTRLKESRDHRQLPSVLHLSPGQCSE